MSPSRKRLRRAHRTAVRQAPRSLRAVPFRPYVRAIARELYTGHREDAQAWCLRKWPRPSDVPPWVVRGRPVACLRDDGPKRETDPVDPLLRGVA